MASSRWEQGGARGYNTAAIILHWLIALAIVVQVLLGWWMNEWVPDHSKIQDQIQTVHISMGITILLLVLLRIAVRIFWPPPPIPSAIPPIERFVAIATHTLFYILLLVIPLSGWLVVSLESHPIHFWGLPWPHMPGAQAVFGNPAPRPLRKEITHIHVFILIWIVLVTLALHVVGALWGQVGGQPVLWRMWPGAKPPRVR